LTDASGSYGTLKYNYDDVGNRSVETRDGSNTTLYTYSTTSNKLNSSSGASTNSFSYDNNGNTQARNSISFSYDDTNRMTQAVNGSLTTNYAYDGKGQRVLKNTNGVISLYIFDKDGKLIAEADATGAIQKEYIYFAGRPLALIDYSIGGGINYYHLDHLGTPQTLTDQNQTVVWNAYYEPFGVVNITVNTLENNLRFPGQYYDGETGLYYNYFRDYDPSLGRYTTSDPLGLLDGVNTYVYVKSNPIIYKDIMGLSVAACMNAAKNRLSSCLNIALSLYRSMQNNFTETCEIVCGDFDEEYGGAASCEVLCTASLGPSQALAFVQYMAMVGGCYGVYKFQISQCDDC